jgi:hypothetical protein
MTRNTTDPKKRTGLDFVQVDLGTTPNSCSAVAWSIVTGLPFEEVLKELQSYQRSRISKVGTYARSSVLFANNHGYRWVDTSPVLKAGLSLSKQKLLKAENLPKSAVVAQVHEHALAVVNHTIYDSFDSRGKRSRKLEGYFVEKV